MNLDKIIEIEDWYDIEDANANNDAELDLSDLEEYLL